MTIKSLLKALAVGAIALVPVSAGAVPVSTGVWYEFGFGGAGGALVSGGSTQTTTNPLATQVGDPAWTFELDSPGTLFVLDLFLSVDQFEMFDGITSLGLTTAPVTGSDCGGDIACALIDANFSRGTYLLAAGSHSITGLHPVGQSGAGVFIINVDQVPLPAALPLFAAGLSGMTLLGWRGRRKKAAAPGA